MSSKRTTVLIFTDKKTGDLRCVTLFSSSNRSSSNSGRVRKYDVVIDSTSYNSLKLFGQL